MFTARVGCVIGRSCNGWLCGNVAAGERLGCGRWSVYGVCKCVAYMELLYGVCKCVAYIALSTPSGACLAWSNWLHRSVFRRWWSHSFVRLRPSIMLDEVRDLAKASSKDRPKLHANIGVGVLNACQGASCFVYLAAEVRVLALVALLPLPCSSGCGQLWMAWMAMNSYWQCLLGCLGERQCGRVACWRDW